MPRVIARIRPIKQPKDQTKIFKVSPTLISVQEDDASLPRNIKFHQVFDQDSENDLVFNYIKNELASSLLNDKNDCTVFSYGETGSGKTYTMYYLIKHFVSFLLGLNSINKLEQYKDIISVEVEISCVEINMVAANREQILDLLNKKKEVQLQFSQIQGANSAKITNDEDFEKHYEMLKKLRNTKATAANSQSSRSHCIFIVKMTVDLKDCTFSSICNFVDLAGSERMSQSRRLSIKGDQQASAINPSLSNFSNIVRMIAVDKCKTGIPFRNSYLTRILQPCFKGEGKLVALFCLNPESPKESHSTLVFAQNMLILPEVKVKKNKVIVTQDQVEKANRALLQEISDLKRQLTQVNQSKGLLEEENLRLKNSLEQHIKQNTENLENAKDMIKDIKDENKQNINNIQETKKGIANAVKNIKKEFGIPDMGSSQTSFNKSDGFKIFLDEQMEKEIGTEGLKIVQSTADIFDDLKAVYRTIDELGADGQKIDLPPQMEGLNFKLNSLMEMVQHMQQSSDGFKNMSKEKYDSILNYLHLLERGCDGLQYQSNKYNTNEDKVDGLKQNAVDYVKEIQKGLGKIRALQGENQVKRPRKSIHERPQIDEADDSRSQYQVRRPVTKIEGRKERYFEDDSDQEVQIPDGSVFDNATELTRQNKAKGRVDYEREPERAPTEYYDSEYYDSEEEAEMEAQNQLEKEIMAKVDKYLKNTELFDKNEGELLLQEFGKNDKIQELKKKKYDAEINDLLKLLPGSRDNLITLIQSNREIPHQIVEMGGLEKIFVYFQQDTYMANMAVLLQKICLTKDSKAKFQQLGGNKFISKLIQVSGSREKDFSRIAGLQLMAQVVEKNTANKDYFLSNDEDITKLMEFFEDKNQGILEAAANALTEIAEDFTKAKDKFLKMGILQKLGYKIILNENNEVTSAMLAALGRMVHKHPASQQECLNKNIQIQYQDGQEMMSPLDGIVQGMNDEDDQVKQVAQQAFLNLILDNDKIEEILSASNLKLEDIKLSSFEALAKVFCNTFQGASKCEKRGKLGDISYFAIGLNDKWTKETAGGSNKEMCSFIKNPQYQIYVPSEGAQVSIYLQGKSSIKYAKHTFFHVTVFKTEIDQKFDVDLTQFIERNRRGREEGAIVTFKAEKMGYYSCVLSHTVVGRAMEYQVAFVADCDIKVQKQDLDEDWAFKQQFYSVWENLPKEMMQVDPEYQQTFWNNPQFIIRKKYLDDDRSDMVKDLVEEEAYVIIRAEHFNVKATRDINGKIKDADEVHLYPVPYAENYFDKRCIGEMQNGPKMEDPLYNIFGDQAQMKIDLSEIDQLAVSVFRTKNQFQEIVTSFFSNVDLEVIQVGKEQEWKHSYSIKADEISQDSKIQFSVKAESNVIFGFQIKDDAQVEDLNPYKYTCQILYPDGTSEATKHNAHGFLSKSWMLQIKPEFVGKSVQVVFKPRDETVPIDSRCLYLNLYSESEVLINNKTIGIRNILASQTLPFEYTFIPLESDERDELLDNGDILHKRLEFKDIENQNLKQCVEALKEQNEMFKQKIQKKNNDEYEYADPSALIKKNEEQKKQIYELQKINQAFQLQITNLVSEDRAQNPMAKSVMQTSTMSNDLFSPANLIETQSANNQKDQQIAMLQQELQRAKQEVENLRQIDKFFIQMNQLYIERFSQAGDSQRPSITNSEVRPSITHSEQEEGFKETQVTKKKIKMTQNFRVRQLSGNGRRDLSQQKPKNNDEEHFDQAFDSFFGGKISFGRNNDNVSTMTGHTKPQGVVHNIQPNLEEFAVTFKNSDPNPTSLSQSFNKGMLPPTPKSPAGNMKPLRTPKTGLPPKVVGRNNTQMMSLNTPQVQEQLRPGTGQGWVGDQMLPDINQKPMRITRNNISPSPRTLRLSSKDMKKDLSKTMHNFNK